MSKTEFLDTLRTQLEGVLSQTEIEGHLHYYNEYITDAVASGKTEEQVTEELGSPVFIARTLMDTAEASEYEERKNGTGQWENGYGREEQGEQRTFERSFRTYHLSPFLVKWVLPAVLILAAVLLIFLLCTIVGAAIAIVARLFVPILLVVLVIAIFKSHG